MVISNSKVHLASSRLYTETRARSNQTVLRGANGRIQSILGSGFARTYTSARRFFGDAGGSTYPQSYLQDYEASNPRFSGLFGYSRNGTYLYPLMSVDDTDRQTNRLASGSKAQDASNAEIAADNTGETDSANTAGGIVTSDPVNNNVFQTYGTMRHKLILSLLDMVRNLSFRGRFEGVSYPRFDSAAMFGQSDRLRITNAANASEWTITESYSTFYEERECTTFDGTGSVVTADGKTIDFHVNLEMSRAYMEQNELTYVTKYPQILTDPLIINLDDAPAQITDQTFFFDLDCDGEKEEIASLAPNSGYLALDRNGDGIINNGSELFGPQSGNGFADLAKYDGDGNGWIDEADDVYKHLKIWTINENGESVLMSLKDADVGAIYLGSSQTSFDLKDEENNLKGRVRSSGIYLHEDGSAGTVQQIDF